MDTVGDAEELGLDEASPSRQPIMTPEALAVTSLSAAVCSLFVTGVSQFLVFLLANSLRLNDGDEAKQYAVVMTPVTLLSFVAVTCGLAALKRRQDDRWVAGLAVAGVAVGAVVFLLAAAGFLATVVSDPSPNTG